MDSDKKTDINQYRRKLIVGGIATAAVTVAPGVILHQVAHAKSDTESVTNKKRWGMLIDTTKCSDGCEACVNACNTEHNLKSIKDISDHDKEQSSQWIRKVTLKDKQTQKVTVLPMMCQHCENPPCVDVCPTGASFKRADNIVLVDKHICIGCRYCMMACPYKARSFIHEELHDQKSYSPRGIGTVESCTFCVHRVDKNQSPACVDACSKDGGKAMLFGDMKDPESELSKTIKSKSSRQIRADLGLNPGVRYHGI